MREYVPRQVRAMLSPVRKGASRGVGWAMQRVMRSAGTVNDYGYVFVITYGRSGSTLLMGMLNAIPGYRILGENYNTLYRLYQADAAIAKGHEKFSGTEHLAPQGSWYGMPRVRPQAYRAELVEAFVRHVLRPEPGDRMLGFKEIRFTPEHVPDLAEYLEFLGQAFPNSKVIFNHRNAASVAKSGWWVKVRNAEARVKAADDRLLTFAADERLFHFFYDEIDDSLGNVRALFRFLGEDLDESAIRRVLGKPHSPYYPANA